MKSIDLLCSLIILLVLISAGFGLLYTTGGESYFVENIYGESIELFGDGIYKNDSFFKAGINKGTDLVMSAVALLLGIVTVLSRKTKKLRLIQLGLLAGLLYYSACISFGVTFNRLFPIYTMLFSLTLFTFIFLLVRLSREDLLPVELTSKKMTGTSVFLFISGCSVLMWLSFIIPAVAGDVPLADIQIYTTEPTFVIDLAVILPTYIGCAIALLRKKVLAYKLAPALLTFIMIIGAVVISQTAFQKSLGVNIPLPQFIGLVVSFVVLGMFGLFLNLRFMRLAR